jgi:hypothetical protein
MYHDSQVAFKMAYSSEINFITDCSTSQSYISNQNTCQNCLGSYISFAYQSEECTYCDWINSDTLANNWQVAVFKSTCSAKSEGEENLSEFVIFIIIAIFLICLVLGYCMYKFWFIKKINNRVEATEEEIQKAKEELEREDRVF